MKYALILLSFAFTAHADNWPHWRGPDGNNICREKGVPVKWDKSNVLWKVPLPGESASTPAVWGDKLYITATDGQRHFAYGFTTAGKQLFKHDVAGGLKVVRGGEGNSTCISAVTDGKLVWFTFSTGDILCTDMMGKEVWKANMQERYGKYRIGFIVSATPVLYENLLVNHACQANKPYVFALDKTTGKEVWKVDRKTDAKAECLDAYTSPLLYKDENGTILVSHGQDYCIGYGLKDGTELWRIGGLHQPRYNRTLRFISNPTAVAGQIVVPSAKNSAVISIDPRGAKGKLLESKHKQWRNPKGTPDVPSPLIHDGLVYLCQAGGGVINCLDAKTGKEIYKERIHGGLYRANPVYADGNIYYTCRDGVITVVKAGRKFEKVAENVLEGDAQTATPAFSNGVVYIHTHKALYAVK